MRARASFVLLFLLLAAPAWAAPGSHHSRTVEALVALPTPIRPVAYLSDEAQWTVTVPEGVVVLVEARGNAPFRLSAVGPEGERIGALTPALHAATLLGAGAWRVGVDPAAGALVRIDVTFDGYVSDVGGAPAAFELRDVDDGDACVFQGTCLP